MNRLGQCADRRTVEVLAQIAGIIENGLCTGRFEFIAGHPTAEHRDGRHTGPLAGLDVPHRVADEDRAIGGHPGARSSATSMMSGFGLAVSTSFDDVTADTRSSLASTLRRIDSSSSGADVAKTVCRPSSSTAFNSSRAPGNGRNSGTVSW